VLRWKKLPYFHMVDCAHGNGVFANLRLDERIAVQTKLIEAIKRHAIQGIAITVERVCPETSGWIAEFSEHEAN
jgi:hypothetical protein